VLQSGRRVCRWRQAVWRQVWRQSVWRRQAVPSVTGVPGVSASTAARVNSPSTSHTAALDSDTRSLTTAPPRPDPLGGQCSCSWPLSQYCVKFSANISLTVRDTPLSSAVTVKCIVLCMLMNQHICTVVSFSVLDALKMLVIACYKLLRFTCYCQFSQNATDFSAKCSQWYSNKKPLKGMIYCSGLSNTDVASH